MDELEILKEIIACADSWDTKARLIGNVMAGDIATVFRSAYTRVLIEHRNSPKAESENSIDNKQSESLLCPKCGKDDKLSLYCDHCIDIVKLL